MPEALIVEVYFEDDEWYAVVDCFLMELLGIDTFQEIAIYCSDGPFIFKEDFLPDFTTYTTIITNDALEYPRELNPENDFIYVNWSGGFNFMNLEWGSTPDAPVSGPGEGQALVVAFVWGDEYYNYTFWLVKANEPSYLPTQSVIKGVFSGYILDQNNAPIPNAEIRYVSEYLMQATYNFPPLITDETGYFCNDNLFARNYHLYKIVIDGADYEFDEYVAIEPDEINSYTYTMDFTRVTENPDPSFARLINYPNPFSTQTVFTAELPAGLANCDLTLKISDVLGKVVSIVIIDSKTIGDNKLTLNWENDIPLKPGNYFVSVTADGAILATQKISIQ
jgi:hypothetical protein